MAVLDLSPKRQDVKWTRGDTWQLRFTFLDTNDNPLDLTGSTWLVQAREGGPDGTLFGTFAVNSSQQASGYIDISLAATTTDDAVPGDVYWYDVQQTRSGEVATPVNGKITVVADVSRTP